MRMRMKTAGVIAGVAVLCFTAGRWSGTMERGRNHGTRVDRKTEIEDHAPPQGRARERTATVSLVEEARMPIPKAKVKELLVKEFGRQNFQYLDHHLAEVLTLLGATEEEAEAMKGVVKRLQENILAAEAESAVLKEQSASRVTLDLTGIRERLEGVRAELDAGLHEALPAEKAELLAECIQWKSFYPMDFLEDVRFEIQRDSGRLRPVVWQLGDWDAKGAVPPSYADDGRALPAGDLFGWRWAKLLEGKTLLPVEKPENGK